MTIGFSLARSTKYQELMPVPFDLTAGPIFGGHLSRQVLPAIQHSKNHVYYIPRKLVRMFFRVDYIKVNTDSTPS